jgi:hypothetical protein
MMRPVAVAAGAFALVFAATPASFAQTVTFATSGGITITGAVLVWSSSFGSVNGFGLGTPGSGQTVMSTTGGVMYTSPYDIVVSGASGSNKAVVKAYMSTNFLHPAILQAYTCRSGCTNVNNYTAISTNVASPTDVISAPGVNNGNTTRHLGIFVSNQNGAGAYTGTDSATLTLSVYNNADSSLKQTHTFALINENVQTALQMTVATAPSGRAISAGSDFSISYVNVNGLGLGPSPNLTVTGVSGGKLYSTPYLLQPSFAGFSSTTGTLQAYVSTDFVHPSQLELRDSSSGSGFSAISKTSGSQTTLTSSAASASTVTRYLGLFVSDANGASVYTGTDNATVTFTLVVP